MTKEELAYAADVMFAASHGEEIEIYVVDQDKWLPIDNPLFHWDVAKYRIKPMKSPWRPFKNEDEFIEAQKQHGLYVKASRRSYFIPTRIDELGIGIYVGNNVKFIDYELLYRGYAMQDGYPCGVKEEDEL